MLYPTYFSEKIKKIFYGFYVNFKISLHFLPSEVKFQSDPKIMKFYMHMHLFMGSPFL